MKKTWIAVALAIGCLALYSCKSVCNVPAGDYSLDKAASSLQATVMKNEKVPVVVKFPKLDASLTLSPLKATVNIGLDTLETGNPARDNNIRSLFFEVAKAANKSAMFELTKLDGDPSTLAAGASKEMKGEGTLSLHGGTVNLSGPLTIAKTAKGYSATFEKAWTVNIKEAGLLPQLANLSDACPQPHRVGLDVVLGGTLVFVKN